MRRVHRVDCGALLQQLAQLPHAAEARCPKQLVVLPACALHPDDHRERRGKREAPRVISLNAGRKHIDNIYLSIRNETDRQTDVSMCQRGGSTSATMWLAAESRVLSLLHRQSPPALPGTRVGTRAESLAKPPPGWVEKRLSEGHGDNGD